MDQDVLWNHEGVGTQKRVEWNDAGAAADGDDVRRDVRRDAAGPRATPSKRGKYIKINRCMTHTK